MSFQDRLLSYTDNIKRKIYDEKFKTSGNEARFIRLTIEEDDFGDAETVAVINHEEIIIEVNNLEEVPVSRLRKDLTTPGSTATTGLYLMDLLPITGKMRFVDQVNKDDILIKKIQDENPNTKPYYLTLKVTDILASLSPNSITSLTFNLAPYTDAFDEEIVSIIESY